MAGSRKCGPWVAVCRLRVPSHHQLQLSGAAADAADAAGAAGGGRGLGALWCRSRHWGALQARWDELHSPPSPAYNTHTLNDMFKMADIESQLEKMTLTPLTEHLPQEDARRACFRGRSALEKKK